MPPRIAKQLSVLDHLRSKTMYAGSREKQSKVAYLYDAQSKEITEREVIYSPNLYKIIVEIIENAADHYKRCIEEKNHVSEIRVSFDKSTGIISCYNDGPGINCSKVKTVDGIEMLNAEMIFTKPMSGDNFDATSDNISIGTNGFGIKLAAVGSKFIELETIDTDNEIHFKQRTEDQLRVINPPEIKKASAKEKSFTRFTFLPDYEFMGYKMEDAEKDNLHLETMIHNRLVQLWCCIDCDIYFNDSKIDFPSTGTHFKILPRLFPDVASYHYTCIGQWEVAVGLSTVGYKAYTFVNSGYIELGTHIDKIRNLLIENFKPRTEKILNKMGMKFNKNLIEGLLFIFIRAEIKNPEFSSQIKDKLDMNINKFKDLTFRASDYDQIWSMLEAVIIERCQSHNPEKSVRVSRSKVMVEKGQDARYAAHKTYAKKCYLWVAEGDSALQCVKRAMNSRETTMNAEYHGYYSIQGVPLCARKQIVRKTDTIIERKERLKEDARFADLVKLLGLDYTKKYTTADEINSLRYGSLVIITDQDEDGKGNIFPLILDFIAIFWKNLIKAGYVKFYNTPIIKCFPLSKKHKYTQEFFFINDYKDWLIKNYGSENSIQVNKDYRIEYFKGLGSHAKEDTPHMFEDYESKMTTIVYDGQAEETLQWFYGNDADRRKTLLKYPPKDEIKDMKTLTITDQCMINSASYMRDNIKRKIPNLNDGLNPAQRNILYVMSRIYKNKAQKTTTKLPSLIGEIIKMTGYHHGDTSLTDTYIKMAHSFPGSNNLPFLMDTGSFGTLSSNGNDAAAARYLSSSLNKRLFFEMFPEDDFSLLPQRYDEGKHVGPEYFSSIVPIALLEDLHIPAHGWAVHIYACHIKDVFKNVRSLINGSIKKAKPMRLWLNKLETELRTTQSGKTYSVGIYSGPDKEGVFHIKGLPLTTYPGLYNSSEGRYALLVLEDRNNDEKDGKDKDTKAAKAVKQTKKDLKVLEIEDRSSDYHLEMYFKIDPKKINYIKENYGNRDFDCWEDYFNLKCHVSPLLNFLNDKDEVVSYASNEDALMEWFVVRKELYGKRMRRKLLMIEMEIAYLENIVRFAKEHTKYKINDSTDTATATQLLEKEGYLGLNTRILNNPGLRSDDEIRKQFYISNDADELGEDESVIKVGKYDYLFNLNYKQKMKESITRNLDKLSELQKEKEKYESDTKPFVGAQTWLNELDTLEATIRLGLSVDWWYGEREKSVYNTQKKNKVNIVS
jgi:DNA topoisomerase-2